MQRKKPEIQDQVNSILRDVPRIFLQTSRLLNFFHNTGATLEYNNETYSKECVHVTKVRIYIHDIYTGYIYP